MNVGDARRSALQANDINPLCDFCCIPRAVPVAALLVQTVTVHLIVSDLSADNRRRKSLGEWYVCRPCLDFIMMHEPDKLAWRAIAYQLSKLPREATISPAGMNLILTDTLQIQAMALDQLKEWPGDIERMNFVTHWVAGALEQPWRRLDSAASWPTFTALPDGVLVDGIKWEAVPCRCGESICQGWQMRPEALFQ